AIDHLNADYKANALITAREYRKNNHLSKTEIYEWLTSSYVGKFTKEEANYAIQKLNLPSEGSQARNKWVGNYYFKSDGKMAKNEWVDGGRYYVESDGKMARGKWVDGGRYYVESDGKMARDKWVDGGRHYVDYDGVRQPKLDGKQYNAALNKAKSYNSVLHMSKKDLYNQLTWNGFSSSVAQYAIDH
ncbi:N-acetylmuramoyl-L-alanine amidase family protein, partial [Salmonella enterica subsp. enterica serovar Typhi]|nr:N-acetylmuramoyl-L-alanine amidase family protein [Salmonella enterica subsp. enterica serovar Typhi]